MNTSLHKLFKSALQTSTSVTPVVGIDELPAVEFTDTFNHVQLPVSFSSDSYPIDIKAARAHKHYFDEMKMCGCGRPEDVQSLMLECLRAFSDEVADAAFEDRGVSLIEKIIKENPAVAAEMIAQFLDSRELLEHGGSVYGSWLSEKGKDVLEAGPLDGLTYGEDEDGNVWVSF